jgi:uncharacterized caspase-like protein
LRAKEAKNAFPVYLPQRGVGLPPQALCRINAQQEVALRRNAMLRSLPTILRGAVAGAALLCGLGAAGAETHKDVKVALVVGNSYAKSPGLKLANADRDAQDIAAALEKDGFAVTLKLDVGKADFEQSLAEFSRVSEFADISMFYYAGHGVQYRGQNYMLPNDNIPRDNKDIRFGSVDLQEIVDAASYAKSKIVVIDACRNTKPDPKRVSTRSVTGVGDEDGLAALRQGSPNMAVLYSAQAGHTALDKVDDTHPHSPFAESMLKHLTEPGRKALDVLGNVIQDVVTATGGVQVPEIQTASLSDDIVLNPSETSAQVWARIKQARDPKALRQFIAEHPDAPEADTAQIILDSLDNARRAAQEVAEANKRAADAQAAADEARKKTEALQTAEAEAKAAEEKRRADEAAKAKAENDRLQASLAAQKAEAERVKQQEIEAAKAREEQARAEQDAAAEQERRNAAERRRLEIAAAEQAKAAADAKAAAEEAQHRAEIEADLRAKDAAQREADEKAKLAQEAERHAEMLAEARDRRADETAVQQKAEEAARAEAARQDEIKRQREAEEQQKKIVAAACAADAGRLADFTRAGEVDAIELLRRESICPTTEAAAEKALTAVAMAQAQTCDTEEKALSRLDAKNVAALTSAADGFKCSAVRQAALQKADDAKHAEAAIEQICAQDAAAVAAVDNSLPHARDELAALAASSCPTTRALTDKAIAEIDERVGLAQDELVRLQCLAPNQATRRFDDTTRAALVKYLTARNAPADAPRLNQDLVDELSDQSVAVCAPAAAPATVEAKAAPGQPGESVIRTAPRPVAPRYIVPKTQPRLIEPRVEHHYVEPTPEIHRPVRPPPRIVDEEAPRPRAAAPAPRAPRVGGGGGGGGGRSGGESGGGGGGAAPAAPARQFSVPAI